MPKSRPKPTHEIVVEATALAVAEEHYSLDEARLPLRLGAYGTLRDAKAALAEVARAEGELRGLVLDPFSLANAQAPLERGLDEVIHLIRPEDVQKSSRQRVPLAHIKIKRIREKPPSWET